MAATRAAASTACPRGASASRLSVRSSRFSSGSGAATLRAAPFSPASTSGAPRGALLVVAGKGKGKQMGRSRPGVNMQRQMPPTPPVDPENEEFVLFVRSKKLPQWIPLSVVKGGTAANMLVKSMSGNFAQDTFRQTLIRNIGQVVYKDREEIEKSLKEAYPPMKAAQSFEYGFKIRDKTNPKNWYIPENVILIPPEDELPKPPVQELQEKAANFLKNLTGSNASA